MTPGRHAALDRVGLHQRGPRRPRPRPLLSRVDPRRGRAARLARGQGRAESRRRDQLDDVSSRRSQADSPGAKASKSPPVRPKSETIELRRRLARAGSRRSGCSSTSPAAPVSLVVNNGHRARSSSRPRPIPRGTSPHADCVFMPLFRKLPPQEHRRGAAARLGRHGREHPEHLRHVPQPGPAAGQPQAAWAGPIMIAQVAYDAARSRADRPDPLPGDPQHQPGRAQLPADPAARRRPDGLPRSPRRSAAGRCPTRP